jgi:hypothetical protein
VPGGTIGRGAESQKKSPLASLDLGDEEVVVGRQDERRVEQHVELHLLPGHRAVAKGELGGDPVDAVEHRVRSREARLQDTGRDLAL